MPDYRITWEIDWPGDTPKAALEAMMLALFQGEWPSGVDHFVVTDGDGNDTAINYLEDDETGTCSACGEEGKFLNVAGKCEGGCEEGGSYECQNCGERWHEEDLNPVKERVAPGEPMPAGECPDCGAVCHEVDDEDVDEEGDTEL